MREINSPSPAIADPATQRPKIEYGSWCDAEAILVWGDPPNLADVAYEAFTSEYFVDGPLYVHDSTRWRKVPGHPLGEFDMEWRPHASGRGSFAARLVVADDCARAAGWGALVSEDDMARRTGFRGFHGCPRLSEAEGCPTPAPCSARGSCGPWSGLAVSVPETDT
jgi:hypothetical protein